MTALKTAIFITGTAVITAGLLIPLTSVEQQAALEKPVISVSSYIVQGASTEGVAELVRNAGGDITHELGVIRAVGAQLTEAQRAHIESQGARVFPDQEVKVANTCELTDTARLFQNKRASWTIQNTGTATATISFVAISWPSENGPLKKVVLDNQKIWDKELEPPYGEIDSDWYGDVTRREISPGTSAELAFDFDEYIDYNQSNYTIMVGTLEGCYIEFIAEATECIATGFGYRYVGSTKVEWSIRNEGSDPITLDSVSVNWPEDNDDLLKVKLAGNDIFMESREPPIATISTGWHTDIRRRRIEAGDIRTLELQFEDQVDTDQEHYTILAEFSEDCAVEFIPDTTTPPVPMTEEEEKEEKRKKKSRRTYFTEHVEADLLHAENTTGRGVTVAVLDTGVWSSHGGKKWLRYDLDGNDRILAAYDALENVQGDVKTVQDENGHGTHVTSIIASHRKSKGDNNERLLNGVAPGAPLVIVKAFDKYGASSYSDVIRGIDWIVSNRETYGIRVLNMSFSAEPRSHYWDDPLNQAVMAAWQAGIVVVASAGNGGPEAQTIGVPGNVPYVVTVGAMTDNRTPLDPSDDYLTTFSAAGPTYEGFVKPEVVAPGGHVLGLMGRGSTIPQNHPEYHDGNAYYYMSGTSQSAAVVSGIAALMLEVEPLLTPDQVKCKLMDGSRPAVAADGSLAYSVFQQGAGMVNAYDAVYSATYDCANGGLDIGADVAGVRHFGGRANQNPDGSYYLMGLDGYLWTEGYLWTGGYL